LPQTAATKSPESHAAENLEPTNYADHMDNADGRIKNGFYPKSINP
jgi:hypothetical protein